MTRKKRMIVMLLGLALVLYAGTPFADDDGHRRRRRGADDEYTQSGRGVRPVDNPAYAEQCGACHFAYPPGLLPADSWRKILSDLDNHNGAQVALESAAKDTISQYLETNSAEKSLSRRSSRIMRSLSGQTPTRITEVPYIRQKHHNIYPEVFKRESIGSFSNCVACHTTADRGVFDDDFVSIPD